MEDTMQRVKRTITDGARWLDAHQTIPRTWRDLINVNRLDMMSINDCVMAQLAAHLLEPQDYRARLGLPANFGQAMDAWSMPTGLGFFMDDYGQGWPLFLAKINELWRVEVMNGRLTPVPSLARTSDAPLD